MITTNPIPLWVSPSSLRSKFLLYNDYHWWFPYMCFPLLYLLILLYLPYLYPTKCYLLLPEFFCYFQRNSYAICPCYGVLDQYIFFPSPVETFLCFCSVLFVVSLVIGLPGLPELPQLFQL